ncbi:MAG: arginine--tRNA ligase [Proteobacteria bacterium]|nr:arginine--tRNA ligase [Pseudomonadota bacterium]
MTNFINILKEQIKVELEDMAGAGRLPAGLDLDRVAVDPPRDPAHGDVATNAALVLAKPAGLKPRALAEELAGRLARRAGVSAAEVAGPGFVNLRLDDPFWHARLRDILRAGPAYGDSGVGRGVVVNVEYVSANPTGPMHVGHGRGAVVGDALAALLEKAGHTVTREYYVNDAGAQVDALAWSSYFRYLEALGATISPETFAGLCPGGELQYRGEYLIPVGQELVQKYGDSLARRGEDGEWEGKAAEEWLAPLRAVAVARMMALIRDDLAALGVRHDLFTSERELVEGGAVERAVEALKARGLVYTGVLEAPKGKVPEDWEPRPQMLFRATQFGDDVDRPLQKSDGSWTYFATDIAYHHDKFRRGFKAMINVWGADHGGYVKRMQAAVKAITGGEGALDVKLCQLVSLLRGGEPVRMSKRAGTFVTLREVIDEVGRDVVRFIMLTRRNDAPLDFDLDRVMEQSRENPVFYVQYAHARCRSALRHARALFAADELSPERLAEAAPVARLTDPGELALIKHMAGWPRVVESAAEAHEPHRVAFYLYDLAAAFHGLWTRGMDDATLRFIDAADRDRTAARLALVQAVATVIASGLRIMGVTPVEEMR